MLPGSAYHGDRTPSDWETSMLPVSAHPEDRTPSDVRVFNATRVSLSRGSNTGQHWESLNADQCSAYPRDRADTQVDIEVSQCWPVFSPSPGWAEHWSALTVSQCWPVFSLSPGIEADTWSALRVSQCWPVFSLSSGIGWTLVSIESLLMLTRVQPIPRMGWHWSALRVSQCYQGVSIPGPRLTLVALRSNTLRSERPQCYQCQPIPGIGSNTGQHWESLNATSVSLSRGSNTLRLRDLNATCVSPSRGSNTLRCEGVRCYPCQPIPGLEHWSALRVSQCYQGQPIPGIEHSHIERPQGWHCVSPSRGSNTLRSERPQCYQCQPIPRIEHPQIERPQGYQCQPIPRIEHSQIWETSMLPVSAYHRDGLNTGQHWESLNATRVSPSRGSNTLRLRDLNATCVSPSRRIEHPQMWETSMLPVSAYPRDRLTLVSIESLSMLTSVQPIPGMGWTLVSIESLSMLTSVQPIPGIEHPDTE